MSIAGKLIQFGMDLTNQLDAVFLKGFLRVYGRSVTPDSTAVTVILEDSNGNVLLSTGTTVPGAETGFAKGSLFIKTDAASGTKGVYENQGTNTSSSFNVIGLISGTEIVETVLNSTGGTLTAGTSVYRSGHDGTNTEVAAADKDDATKPSELVLSADILDGATGTAYYVGTVPGLDTTGGGGVGAAVYTGASGVFSLALPTGSTYQLKPIGIVTVEHATTGEVFFFPGMTSVRVFGTSALQNDAVTLAKMAALAQGSLIVGGAANAPTALDCKTTGQLLLGDGTDLASVAMSGDATIIADGTLTIANDAVSLAKMAGITRGNIIVGDASGDPALLDCSTDARILIGDGNDLASVAVSGDFGIINTGVATITSHAGNVLVATTMQMQFHDTAMYVHASADGALNVVSDGTVTVQADGNLFVTNTAGTGAGVVASIAGQNLSLIATDAGVAGNGPDIAITAGAAHTSGDGGSITLTAQPKVAAGSNGILTLNGSVYVSDNPGTGAGEIRSIAGQNLIILATDAAVAGAGPSISITAGAGHTNNKGGDNTLTGGAGAGTGGGGAAGIVGGASGAGATGNGAAATVTGGAALSTNGDGGGVDIDGGAKAGSGTDGTITLGKNNTNEVDVQVNLKQGSEGYFNVKTLKYTVLHSDFSAVANKNEQGIQLGGKAIIPALGRVLEVIAHCTVDWTGSAGDETGLGTELGNASGGAQYAASANVDDVGDLNYTANAGAFVVAPSASATSVYISCTPTINDWDELTAGTTEVYVTFVDNSVVAV